MSLTGAVGAIPRPAMLAASLAKITALAVHGLFINVADAALVADGEEMFLLQSGSRCTLVKPGEPSPSD